MLGKKLTKFDLDFPTIIDVARGLTFIESIIESTRSDKKWYKVKKY